MNALEKICKDLGLPKGDSYTQDWVYELPENYRTREWLNKYIDAYLNNNYNEQGKNLLMSLMLDILNDSLGKGVISDKLIFNVLDLLLKNYKHHLQLIDYWSLDDEHPEDCFALTPEIRKIKKQVGFTANTENYFWYWL